MRVQSRRCAGTESSVCSQCTVYLSRVSFPLCAIIRGLLTFLYNYCQLYIVFTSEIAIQNGHYFELLFH